MLLSQRENLCRLLPGVLTVGTRAGNELLLGLLTAQGSHADEASDGHQVGVGHLARRGDRGAEFLGELHLGCAQPG